MQNIKKSHSSVSDKMLKTPIFLTLNPLLIPGLYFFETGHLAQMLHSVGLYHHAKNKKIHGRVSVKDLKPRFLTLNPLLIPGLFFVKPDI